MDDGDITDRGDFDRAVQARFPKARRHRKELPTGFEDTFRVGFVEVGIRVWDTKLHGTPSYKPNVDGLVIEVRGIRQAVGGSSAALWRKHGSGWVEACEALDTAGGAARPVARVESRLRQERHPGEDQPLGR